MNKDTFGKLIFYMASGNNVLAKVTTPLNFCMIFFSVIKLYGINISLKILPILLFAVSIAALIIGYFYNRFGLYEAERATEFKLIHKFK